MSLYYLAAAVVGLLVSLCSSQPVVTAVFALIVGAALLGLKIAGDIRQGRREYLDGEQQLRERADAQHRAYLAGRPEGVYGQYPPAV